jgi:acetate kinase
MADTIAVLNAGSSSIKFSLFSLQGAAIALELRGEAQGLFTAPHFVARDSDGATLAEKRWPEGEKLGHEGALAHLVDFLRGRPRAKLVALAHRVVHGGLRYPSPVQVDAGVLAALEKLVPLAPLHQPHNLAPIRALLARAPDLPQIACFDTSFHRTQQEIAQMFALPAALHREGVRRYGFHGLSYEYIASRLASLDGAAARGRTVVMHLGNGSSLCAMLGGRSVAASTGFTALDGLAMGTRCGALDPGVILYLLQQCALDAAAVEKLLYKESGLLGVSGISSDMRELLARDEPAARLAIDLYVYRIRRELGSHAAALGGLDAIVFTAGIGENAAVIRSRICRDAAWLGVELDAQANSEGGPRISAPGSRVSVWVVPTNEELVAARHARDLLHGLALEA